MAEKIDLKYYQETVPARYQLLRFIGQGGAGAVFSATDTQTGQPVAVKVLKEEALAVDPVSLKLEFKLLSSLDHPHILRVLDYGVGPRGSLGLLSASRALAMLRGRDYVLPADVADIAPDVLAHRLVLTFDAVADGVDPRSVVARVLQCVAPPQIAPNSHDLAEVAS